MELRPTPKSPAAKIRRSKELMRMITDQIDLLKDLYRTERKLVLQMETAKRSRRAAAHGSPVITKPMKKQKAKS